MGTSVYNSGLKKYKDLHKDCEFVLIATGPTLDKFQKFPSYERSIKVGVNKIYDNQLIDDLDYYFFGSDYYISKEHREKIEKISPGINKFSSVYRDGKETGLGNINRED